MSEVKTFSANCESGHPFWGGKSYADRLLAVKEGQEHDRKVHGGEETAIVLPDQ